MNVTNEHMHVLEKLRSYPTSSSMSMTSLKVQLNDPSYEVHSIFNGVARFSW